MATLLRAIKDGNIPAVLAELEGKDINAPDALRWTPLRTAARFGTPEVVAELLRRGAKDPVAPVTAATSGNVENFKLIVDAGGDVNLKDFAGRTPLMLFLMMPSEKIDLLDIIDYIASKGGDINVKDAENKTAITIAIDKGRADIVKKLLEAGADATVDALTYAIKYAMDIYIIKAIVEKGADVNGKDTDGYSLLGTATLYNEGMTNEIVKFLVENGADVNTRSRGVPIISMIAETEKVDLMEFLISKGADVNAKDDKGVTTLMRVIRILHLPFVVQIDKLIKIVELLLANGADPNIADSQGRTAIFLLSIRDKEKVIAILRKLVERGADINHKSADNVTPLLYSITNRKPEVAEALVELGADVNAKSTEGMTPLNYAVAIPIIPGTLVTKLLDKGADINAQDVEGVSPLHMAVLTDNRQVFKILIDRDDINLDLKTSHANLQGREPRTVEGQTPLMIAAENGLYVMVRDLLEEGADKTLKDATGRTARSYAIGSGDQRIIGLLREERVVAEDTSLWKGFNQADVELFDGVFNDLDNVSCCPVCLGFVIRSEACRYMNHDCMGSGSVAHDKLYKLYANEQGNVAWCTICSRVSFGHRHFKLSKHDAEERPDLAVGAGEVFGSESDCIASGGGGYDEKITRLDRILVVARELQAEVGKMPSTEARKRLIEAAWDSALTPLPNAREILTEKKWTVSKEDFPAAEAPVAAAPEADAPDVVKPADEAELVPIFHESGFDIVGMDENVPTIQFVHKKRNGTINRHEDSYIGKDSLEELIKTRVREFGAEEFGRCFAYPSCDAKLYPADIDPYITDRAVFEDYRKKFNRKFAAQQGGAKPLFVVNVTDTVSCALPEKKKKGGRTYRRQQKRKARTYRKRKTN